MTGSVAQPKLAGRRVLIVEDDYYLATDLQADLESSGAVVLGPCSDVAGALRHLSGTLPECALVDINLGTGPSFVIADRLSKLAIPFAFVTGYDQGIIPPRFSEIPRLEKPVGRATPSTVLAGLMPRR